MAFKLATLRDLPRQITSDLSSHLSIMKMSPVKNQSQKEVSVLLTKLTLKIKRSLSRRLQANRMILLYNIITYIHKS